MNSLVSILLPTFARRDGGYLERAIESVLAQTHVDFEFLIVDDGSTDGSADLIEWYTRQDSRVRHVRFERNIGLPAMTLGLAYAQASGDKIAFIFDDCTIVPHHLERLAGALDAHPEALMAYGQAEAKWMNGGSLIIGQAYDAQNMRKGNNHIPNASVMLRREAIDTVGWYDPHVLLKRFCDWDLWLRIGERAAPVFIPEILAFESGTNLKDSLGERVTVMRDLMLRYSRTARSEALRPERLSAYDPFRTDIPMTLSPQDKVDLDQLTIEHFISVGNNEELLSRFGQEYSGTDDAKLAKIRARYLDRRVKTLATERNELQYALLSTHHNDQSAARIAALEAELRSSELRHEANSRTWATERQSHQMAVASVQRLLQAESERRLDLEKRLDLLFGSTSWRITAPIRGIKRLINGQLTKVKRGANGEKMAAPRDVESTTPTHSSPIKPMRILAVGDATTSTELCVHWPLDFMAQHLGVEYTYYDVHSLPADEELLEKADVLLLMRCFTPSCVDLVHHAERMGLSIVYMTDDDFERLIDSEPGSPALAGLIEQLRSIHAAENIREMAASTDLAIVFSEDLRQKFAERTKTCLVPAMAGVEFYDRLTDQPRSEDQSDEIRIGYAGSLTHDRDVALITPSLRVLLDKHDPYLVVESIGQRIDGLVGHPRYRHFDHVAGLPAFSVLQHARSWDIGLAPLEMTPFNQAKTDNKFRSYGAAGIPTVYTRIAHFVASVRDGETGLLVDNDESSWTKALERLIQDRQLRHHIAGNAREEVRNRFGIASISFLYRRLLAEAASGVKILVLGHLHIATTHIDARIPFAELRRRGTVRYRMREVADATDGDFEWAQVLVIIRACEPHISAQIRRAQERGVKVIFSWDDDFFSIPEEHADIHAFYNAPEVRSSLEHALEHADLVKASTPRLAEVTRRYTDRVMTAPYGFDMSLLPVDLPPRDDGRIRIGYFGSLGRGSEFDCVMDALKRICDKHPEVDLEFFGYLPADLKDVPRINHLTFTDDYESSIKTLAERRWDIGLAPLAISDLNRAKLPTKYRDYGAVRAAGVYTDIETYQTTVKHNVTGLLTQNTVDGWFDCLDRLIRDPALRNKIADAAFDDVSQNHNLDVALNAWMDALRRIGFTVPRST